MKKLLVISSILVATTSFIACGSIATNNRNNSVNSTTNNGNTNNNSSTNNNGNTNNTSSNNNAINNRISIDEAKKIALNHLNLNENEVSFKKVEYDFDYGIEKYEVEFYYNNNKYEYKINAKTGDIIGYDYDVQKHSRSQQANNNNIISIDEAKKIALNHSNLNENQVSFKKAKYEFDDGIGKYEIEFYYNFKEYEYEINSSNGEIIKYSID